MKNVANTIEDLLEILAGLQGQAKMQIESSDATIMYSIARQTFKGTALTDRQYALMQEKLQTYRNQFTALDYDYTRAVDTLRQPLRYIDRSKYIKIVDTATVFSDKPYESYKQSWHWIEVRFPFSKKLIVKIESLIRDSLYGYEHKKGSHQHFFALNERNVFNIITELKDSNFEVDDELLSYYEVLEDMNKNKNNYIPGVYNFKLKNLNDRAIDYMISSIGDVDRDNLSRYYDRREMFGLHHFDEDDLEKSLFELSPLSQKIAKRNKLQVFVNSQKYNFNQLVESLLELDRFPILVSIPDKEHLDFLSQVHQSFKNIIPEDSSSVLFRLENSDTEGSHFNEYVRYNKLNNPLDNNTKIVYTLNNKVPKPLVKSDWRPMTILMLDSSRLNSQSIKYAESCDLIIHYDEAMSQYMRFQKDGIQEL